jgi:hypothetical protein
MTKFDCTQTELFLYNLQQMFKMKILSLYTHPVTSVNYAGSLHQFIGIVLNSGYYAQNVIKQSCVSPFCCYT